jgi:hypothetical protein
MYIPFLLFVIVIVLVAIFWELSKINARLKKAIGSPALSKDNQRKEP